MYQDDELTNTIKIVKKNLATKFFKPINLNEENSKKMNPHKY